MPAEYTRVLQEFAAGDHGVEFRFGHVSIAFPGGLGRAAWPGGARNGLHRPRNLENFLYQSRFPGTRGSRNDEHQRFKFGGRHSMFWTCSRNFSISARISKQSPVIARASDSTPGVLESMVFASRCISCNRKSSFLPS